MKLLRYGPIGQEKPGMLDVEGNIRDLSMEVTDIAGLTLLPDNIQRLQKLNPSHLPLVDKQVRLGPCVDKVGKFIGIGLNYSDHAAETHAQIPKEPMIFSKFTSALCGPNDNIVIPRGSTKTDWEVELGVIIGTSAKYVAKENALDYVVGYCVVNDISERKFQLEGTGQFVKGKSCDNFGPIGPWLVTRDEIADPQQLALWLTVDGHRYQNGSTKNMIFSVAYLVSYLSHFFTLYPGDIISTGTPAGVGLGQKPNPLFLKPNQTIHLGITGLGEQQQQTVAEEI